MNNEAPRILICRLSAIGDCVLTMPLLCALRERYPNAHIAWAVEKAGSLLLEGHPCLDELIVVPKGWLKSPRAVWQLRAKLRAGRFDIALDPQSLTKSAVLAWLSGAQRRIGFHSPRGRELSLVLNREFVAAKHSHIVDAQLDLLKPLGIESPPVQFRLPVVADVEAKVDEMIRQMHLGCDFIAINPGAGWESKLWPAERYGIVARALGERYQLPAVVVWSGDRERAWAETIVARSGGRALVGPRTSLPELAAFMRRATMYLGSDTGPLHIAAAVGTPCVALFGPTLPSDCGPYGEQHLSVQKALPPEDRRLRRHGPNDAMRKIDPDSAIDACERLLQIGPYQQNRAA